jgi:tight adherence protein C
VTLQALIPWATFLLVSGVVLLGWFLATRPGRLEGRLRELAGKAEAPAPRGPTVKRLARSALPKVAAPLIPDSESQRTRLQTRLLHAGLYGRQALVFFLAVKMTLMLLPWLLGVGAGVAGLLNLRYGIPLGAVLSIGGMLGPGLWLNQKKAQRHALLRRALPDMLDVLVICMEGGLSLAAALRRVAGELRALHPVLGLEINIVLREVQLGQPLAEGLRHFAERSDLDEVRTLAALIEQTERFGAGLTKALRTHAETLRFQRSQDAEESAQRASAKVLFPTLLFLFPAMFVIILGPAALQLRGLMNGTTKSKASDAQALEAPLQGERSPATGK